MENKKSLVRSPRLGSYKWSLKPGDRFGRLEIIEAYKKNKKNSIMTKCDCGTISPINCYHLKSGLIKSCGCLRKEMASINSRTHGMGHTRIYEIWGGIKKRCFNKNSINWKNYGGKGVTICDRWLVFENFYADMGEPPTDKHSIDRYPDTKGNYEPENCRWATSVQQNLNKDVRLSSTGIRGVQQVGKSFRICIRGMRFGTQKKIEDAEWISKEIYTILRIFEQLATI